MKKILVGSPVRQKHQVLEQFLRGLDEADIEDFDVTYYFVDDNVDELSTQYLHEFAKNHATVITPGSELTSQEQFGAYVSNEVMHIWDASSIRKVAYFKDTIIEYALANGFDYLFFVDSDIVVDKCTIQHLASRNVEIVSNVFWTQWQPNWELEPQCFWMPALNRQSRAPFSPPIDPEEARQIQRDFFAKMRIPGIYRVDGLGACTLIARSALEKGTRFREIPNLSLLGEDRHFCVRAGALGITLYFDTVYPVYHIYREEYLDRVDEFKRDGFKYDMCQTYRAVPAGSMPAESELVRIWKRGSGYLRRKLESRIHRKKHPPMIFDRSAGNSSVAALLIVRDESVKYLKDCLTGIRGAADCCIVLDGTGDGRLAEMCGDMLLEHGCSVIKPDQPGGFTDQEGFRRLWQEAERLKPGWILALNAQEILPGTAGKAICHLVRNTAIDMYRFRCFDMWNAEEYREDAQWDAHRTNRPYLVRFAGGHQYDWSEPWCERFPREVSGLRYANIQLNIKNMRWADAQDRRVAASASTSGGYGLTVPVASLLDPEPVLKRYCEIPDEF